MSETTREAFNPVSDELLANALVYIRQRGDLWEFKCADEIVPAIYACISSGRLCRLDRKKKRRLLTLAGDAFVRAVLNR